MERVNEQSTAYLTCTFRDKAGQTQQPTAITYRVDDVFSGAQVVGDTIVIPGASIEITLPPAANAILGTLGNERRRVTVTATYGEADAVRAEHIYEVVNLGAVA